MRQLNCFCMVSNNPTQRNDTGLFLPRNARLPVNRCNLPAVILGSLTFQQHPAALYIDGVQELHAGLFQLLQGCDDAADRARQFVDYMTVYFDLETLQRAGRHPETGRDRINADYRHILRGWLFDPDGREAAAMKGWVESRFGLLPRYHKGSIQDLSETAYQRYLEDRAAGLYNTNALEAQLDLVYSYCQYELACRYPDQHHITLYRGQNGIDPGNVIKRIDSRRLILLLNSLNAFSYSEERADEFGDQVLEVEVPLSKIFYFTNLLPGLLQGEDEYIVLGGLYDVLLCQL
jgi:NAD+--dinitrogen-reductase ADP-D-ribosyltransferase